MAIAQASAAHVPGFRVALDGDASVLWLTGEHDIATVHALRLVLIDVIALDTDVVVDLSEVTFVGSIVIRELDRARQHLASRGRWLTVRAPSTVARRTFAICESTRLFDTRIGLAGS
jgi:anti-anti-sigma factor